ncbi:hypothetical protein OQA88_2111 [Cercophora sp. LCS_1]
MATFAFTPRPFYPSLLSQNREIRLLHLQPGTGDDAIQCRLTVAPLDSNPCYEALSYQWGRVPTNVSVDKHMVTIPMNLKRGLKSLRLVDHERVLWADAICINQSDVAERNAQVALMADIYRKCEHCLVRLGGTASAFDDPDDRRGFVGGSLPALLAALATKRHRGQPDAPPFSAFFGPTSIPLMEFIIAGWWMRIWVVQEVVLAPRSTVICGTLEMDFAGLKRAAEFVDEDDISSSWTSGAHITDDLCRCMDSIENKFIWADLLKMRDRVFRLLQVDRHSPEGFNAPAITASPMDAPPVGSYPKSIIGIMLAVRTRDCTDPRDEIFGILSLVRDWGSWAPIRADYAVATEGLFLDFAKKMVLGEPGLKTLLLSQGIRSAPIGMACLPSWVPDWSQKGSGYDSYLWQLETQRPRTKGAQSVSIHGLTIRLRCGLPRGAVTDVTGPGVPLHKSYGQPPSMEDFQSFTGMLRNWSQFAGMRGELSLVGILRRRMCRWEMRFSLSKALMPHSCSGR